MDDLEHLHMKCSFLKSRLAASASLVEVRQWAIQGTHELWRIKKYREEHIKWHIKDG